MLPYLPVLRALTSQYISSWSQFSLVQHHGSSSGIDQKLFSFSRTPHQAYCCSLIFQANSHGIQKEEIPRLLYAYALLQSEIAVAATIHVGLTTFQSSAPEGSLANVQAIDRQTCQGETPQSETSAGWGKSTMKQEGTATCVLRQKV